MRKIRSGFRYSVQRARGGPDVPLSQDGPDGRAVVVEVIGYGRITYTPSIQQAEYMGQVAASEFGGRWFVVQHQGSQQVPRHSFTQPELGAEVIKR